MLCFTRSAVLLMLAAMMAAAQPALTTIEDILYRADGTRFSGTIFINWNAFQAGDTSNIATSQVVLPIVNGVLKVKLVPTTTASAGANYQVTFNAQGKFQFSQTWAVPPSSIILRIRDVLVGQGTVIGPPPVTAPIQISDVIGLANALALTPSKGVGFAIGRTAVINQSGQIDGASGNLSDCVRVDGSSGVCGGSGGGVLPLFSDAEVPLGSVNGVNTVFTLAFPPSPAASLELYRNGLRMEQGADYSISGNTITFFLGSTPQAGDLLQASYRYGNPNNPLGSLTSPQVICSSVGGSTSSTVPVQLGSCTIPAGLLGAGDRVQIHFHFVHQGTATGFTGLIQWAGATFLSRPGIGTETALTGTSEFGIYASAQSWNAQSWGNSLSFATAVGSAAVDTTQSVKVGFLGQLSGASADSVFLSNFTVVRLPAQANP